MSSLLVQGKALDRDEAYLRNIKKSTLVTHLLPFIVANIDKGRKCQQTN